MKYVSATINGKVYKSMKINGKEYLEGINSITIIPSSPSYPTVKPNLRLQQKAVVHFADGTIETHTIVEFETFGNELFNIYFDNADLINRPILTWLQVSQPYHWEFKNKLNGNERPFTNIEFII